MTFIIIVTVPPLSLSEIKLSNGSFPQHITLAFPIRSETLDGATSEGCCEKIYRAFVVANFQPFVIRTPLVLASVTLVGCNIPSSPLPVHTYPHSLTTTIAMILIITATTSALLEHGFLREGCQMAEHLCFSFLLGGFHNDLVSLGSLRLHYFQIASVTVMVGGERA